MTNTLSRKRISKADPEIEFLGSVDELQAWIGVCDIPNKKQIQRELYEIMSGNTVDFAYDTSTDHDGQFTLPDSWINIARTVCRRAERRAVEAGMMYAIPYLNRLSDYLYKIDYEKK